MSTLRLGDIAPDFTVSTTEGEVNFHEWLGDQWGILFSHPADYTPVCTGLASHKEWIKDINETQNTEVNFPIIADEDRKVAELYDMIHPEADSKLTIRSVFIVGSDKKIKLILSYPASTGRNFDELVRVIDSLQLTAYRKLATPANWKHGDDCVISPSVKNEEIAEMFPKGHTEIKPYLRMTPMPD